MVSTSLPVKKLTGKKILLTGKNNSDREKCALTGKKVIDREKYERAHFSLSTHIFPCQNYFSLSKGLLSFENFATITCW